MRNISKKHAKHANSKIPIGIWTLGASRAASWWAKMTEPFCRIGNSQDVQKVENMTILQYLLVSGLWEPPALRPGGPKLLSLLVEL